MFLRVCLKVLWIVVFEKKASVFASWSQVTKSFVYPIVLKGFCYVLTLFNNFVPPLNLVDNLAFRMFNGTGAGHRMDHECNGAKCLWQFALKGLWSFRFRQHSKASSRDLWSFDFVLPKILDVQAWPILEGNMWDYPRGCKCDCVLISCICLVLGYLAFDFMYMQTLGLTMV